MSGCMVRAVVLVVAVVVVSVLGGAAVMVEDYPKVSPFEAVKWNGDVPQVQVAGEWFELIAINGVDADALIQFGRETYGDKARKRFNEDIVQVLSKMGHRPKAMLVDLTLRELGGAGAVVEKPNVMMTEANRRGIRDGNDEMARGRRLTITKAAALHDLDVLQDALENQYSYLHRRGVDYEAQLDAIRNWLKDVATASAFALRIQQLLALFGDGHTRVLELDDTLDRGVLPFALASFDEAFIAFDPDTKTLLEPEQPFLIAINGVPIDRYVEIVDTVVFDGSPQVQRRVAAHLLGNVGWLCEVNVGDEIQCTFADSTGGNRVERAFEVVDQRPQHDRDKQVTSRRVDTNLGVLSIPTFSDRHDRGMLNMLRNAMQELAETDGLIIDVRGNGGGSRDGLRVLMPYFMDEDAQPVVVNVGKYRLSDQFERDHLEARFMYRRDSDEWNDAERGAIDVFAATFEPQWQPAEADFSEWHYMVIGSSDDAEVYFYDRPVVVLCDAGCYSATDIFLGAMHELPNVTLMGQSSGGGSGRARPVRLPNSGLTVLLSSMVSYQPNGTLYDGNGVQPDVAVEPTMNDAIGRTDSTFHAAVELLSKRAR